MPPRQPPALSVGSVLSKGMAGFLEHANRLLTRSSYLMAVPALVLLIRQATDHYWLNMVVWLLGLALGGYAAWPLSRNALAAVSSGRPPRLSPADWWVRDGFVRASVAFFLTVAVGTVFLVVPGIMVLMIYSLYPFAIVDRRAAGFQALALSSELSKGNRIKLLRLVAVCLAFFVPGMASLYLWSSSPWGAIALWILGTPALAAASTIMASAYRSIRDARDGGPRR